jgi:hypothetical protein
MLGGHAWQPQELPASAAAEAWFGLRFLLLHLLLAPAGVRTLLLPLHLRQQEFHLFYYVCGQYCWHQLC